MNLTNQAAFSFELRMIHLSKFNLCAIKITIVLLQIGMRSILIVGIYKIIIYMCTIIVIIILWFLNSMLF